MRRRRRPTLHHAVKDKRVTVRGPVKQPEMDFMSHRGGSHPPPPFRPPTSPPLLMHRWGGGGIIRFPSGSIAGFDIALVLLGLPDVCMSHLAVVLVGSTFKAQCRGGRSVRRTLAASVCGTALENALCFCLGDPKRGCLRMGSNGHSSSLFPVVDHGSPLSPGPPSLPRDLPQVERATSRAASTSVCCAVTARPPRSARRKRMRRPASGWRGCRAHRRAAARWRRCGTGSPRSPAGSRCAAGGPWTARWRGRAAGSAPRSSGSFGVCSGLRSRRPRGCRARRGASRR